MSNKSNPYVKKTPTTVADFRNIARAEAKREKKAAKRLAHNKENN